MTTSAMTLRGFVIAVGSGGGVLQPVGDVIIAAAHQEAHTTACAALAASVLVKLLERNGSVGGWRLMAGQASQLFQELPQLVCGSQPANHHPAHYPL